jgi:mRNA interferase MazF
MKQREIWEMYFSPVKGSEQSGRRPAVIISGNALNDNLGTVIVCPLTTKIKNYKGNVTLNPNKDNGLESSSEILTFHIRSVSKERFKNKIGIISKKELEQIIKTLGDLLKY